MTASGPMTLFHVDLNFVNLSAPYLRRWLKKLADMGYTGLLWELENKIRWETCPECVWPEALSKAEFRELLDYARELGLESMPLLQTIGHGEYVLLQEKYRSFRERPDEHTCYCTSRPAVRAFLKRWIAEYLDLFGPLRHFHLGGDEAYAFASCPECARHAAEHGRNHLYADHIRDLAAPLLARGIRPGIWCDMVLHYPDQMRDIPRDFVIWDWNYWSDNRPNPVTRAWGQGLITRDQVTPALRTTYPTIVDADGNLVPFYTTDFLKNAGFDVMLCSSSRSHGDSVFCPDFDVHTRNVVGVAQKTAQTGILGQCVTSWAVRLNPWETQDWILRLAPRALRHPDRPAAELLAEVAAEQAGGDPAPILKALRALGQGFPCAGAGSTGIQWSRGKDSLPAPAHYLADRIAAWKRDQPAEWTALREKLHAVSTAFPAALGDLATALQRTDRGLDALEPWLTAGGFQVQQARLATLILDEKRDPALIPWIETLKSRYADWLADTGQTPLSARQNAGLVYDCLIEYMRPA